jgi:hypothetical protein
MYIAKVALQFEGACRALLGGVPFRGDPRLAEFLLLPVGEIGLITDLSRSILSYRVYITLLLTTKGGFQMFGT